ncbi:hemolytic protein HlpA [Opitutales bacterium ASA1]|uniref:glycosyltransferase family 2 protein n=1 Tax=Congregicoccus parvus TaxID=3081749 RepID=UPI002B2F5D67|nr:hemolytic protein HlpA [Opitutales bacterium ASA1]
MHTPVAFIIFNRPDTTERVFAALRAAKPRKLFVIADGPRPGRPDDVAKCAAARAIIDRVDWECEVHRNFAEHNLGCGQRPATGLSWVFEHVDRAIILEDDCVPHPSFFRYCDELLERYADDERVMMVSGNNFLPDGGAMPHSYTFFRFLNLWGWATWRRAWQGYDFEMKSWPSRRRAGWVRALSPDPRIQRFWSKIYDSVYTHISLRDIWDYQFAYSVMERGGLGIAPSCNLVSNIGWGADATHTTGTSDLAALPAREMEFPLRHPTAVEYDQAYDELVFNTVFSRPGSDNRRKLARVRDALSERVPLDLKRWWFERSRRGGAGGKS